MEWVTDLTAWAEQKGQTVMGAMSVKRTTFKLGDTAADDAPTHGLISEPPILSRQVSDDSELYDAVASAPQVVVVGHGWPMPGEFFVWRGTPQEFAQTWQGD